MGLAEWLGLSNLLLCMAMGAIVANFSADVDEIMDICDSITPPIFMLFFVASGADLKLSVLPTVGMIGAIYIVLRVVGKYVGALVGGAMSRCDANVRKFLGRACCRRPAWPSACRWPRDRSSRSTPLQIRAVILCGTLIYELIDPAVTKFSLKRPERSPGNKVSVPRTAPERTPCKMALS